MKRALWIWLMLVVGQFLYQFFIREHLGFGPAIPLEIFHQVYWTFVAWAMFAMTNCFKGQK